MDRSNRAREVPRLQEDDGVGQGYLIDPVIEPLVLSLNRLPSVQTISSCDGHADERRPHVAFFSDEGILRLMASALTVLNSQEPPQLRAYIEILDYDGTIFKLAIRFHHNFAPIGSPTETVAEWHRRIRVVNTLVRAELAAGLLRAMVVRAAFGWSAD